MDGWLPMVDGDARARVRRPRTSRRTDRRGLTLAEVTISTFLVGMLMVAALRSVGSAARSWIAAADAADGHALAQQLLAEVVALPYEDAEQAGNFGPEAGEILGAGVRTALDDVDDYKDCTDSPPKAADGTPLAGFELWQRTADVQKVHDGDHSVRNDKSADKGIRLITVTATSPAGQSTVLQTYRSVSVDPWQPQGTAQQLVNWVGITLQAGDADAVTGGVALPNHASDQ